MKRNDVLLILIDLLQAIGRCVGSRTRDFANDRPSQSALCTLRAGSDHEIDDTQACLGLWMTVIGGAWQDHGRRGWQR
jgi:hypothetical protein